MTEYIDRADVINLIKRRYENPEICEQEINEIPAADVTQMLKTAVEQIGREAWEPCRYCGMAPFMDGVDLKPCANGYMGVEAAVGKCRDDEAVGMVIYYKNASAGYLDFAYCPFCGRPQTEEAWSKLENQLKAVKQMGACEHEEKPSSPALQGVKPDHAQHGASGSHGEVQRGPRGGQAHAG